jgi:hypothetical protein
MVNQPAGEARRWTWRGTTFEAYSGGRVLRSPGPCRMLCLEEHVNMRMTNGWLEPIRGQLDEKPKRVSEVDRVYEASIFDAMCWMPRSSSRCRCCANVACEIAKAT